MTRPDLDRDLERLGEALHAVASADLAAERRDRGHPHPRRRPRPRRRMLAGSTLGLAGVGVALVLTLSASTSPPAYAITHNGDGSVTVQINDSTALPAANRKLWAMGVRESVTIYMAKGPAPVSGAVRCVSAPDARLSGPPLRVLIDNDSSEAVGTRDGAGHPEAQTYHLRRCVVTAASAPPTASGEVVMGVR